MDTESSTSDTLDDSTLYDVVDAKRGRNGRVARRVLLWLLALFVLTMLAGVFGQVSLIKSASPGYELTVTAPRTTRAGMDATVSVELLSTQKISGPISVEIEQDYFNGFSTHDFSPAPDGESSDGKFLVLEYDAPDKAAFRLDINGTMSQDSSIFDSGEVRVYIGDELVASAELKTWKVL